MIRVITDYLDASAKRFPDKTAFADGTKTVSFSQLRRNAMNIAQAIIQKQLFKKPVAVFLDKGIECIESFLAVAYSGNYYTMIDTAMPDQRIGIILQNLNPDAVITSAQYREKVETLFGTDNIILYEEAVSLPCDEDAVLSVTKKVIDSDVLYVLYTSGSTGIPKGVITPHRAVIGYVEAGTAAFHMDSETVIGNQAPFYFVISVIDIYYTIKNGGTTHIIPKEYFTFPGKLVRYIADNKITFLNWVSSALSLVANYRAFTKADLSCVKTVIFSGEVMPIKHLNAWMDALPGTTFINGYGSTEVTDNATYYVVSRRFKETDLLPLGIPLSNTSILVINEDNQPAKPDETGELCVRGSNLSYGYYNDPERTEKVFIQNPLNSVYRETVYRTGDIVRYNEYGEIEYVGRKDFQIKHMGYRIELGEIEVNISSIDGVDEVCCTYDHDHQRIVAFYTGRIEEKDLGERIRNLVPEYMCPNKRIRLEQMPHNLNGKIDRAKINQEWLKAIQ